MSQPVLQYIATKNYKNLYLPDPVEFNNLNILLGANGSGKSNYINSLKFLRDCLYPTKYALEINGFEDAVNKIGGAGILDNTIEDPASVYFVYCFAGLSSDSTSKNHILELSLLVNRKEDRKQAVVIDQESLKVGDKVIIDFPHLYLYEPASNVIEDARKLLDFVSQWQFYNANSFDLEKIKTSETKITSPDKYVSASGDNLALVFENLIREDIFFEETINKAMTLVLPRTYRIRCVRSQELSLVMEWYSLDTKKPLCLKELSDGTIRMLCWAIILHSPVLPSLLVIDEPELGLHVAWMRILSEWIKMAAHKTQIIIATHSPDLLDHFTDCLEKVYCFDSYGKSHFSIKKLTQEMLADKLEEGWQLGDLYRVGDPTIGGWPW
ncbi:AAA family ATPase [Cylindrospermopsis sp. CR12]|uniref:AAA family ATPase n=1 Tax=Cylindrospermopsis sp. CR12 TaxID=1747196 RepID=UPI000708D2E9|nr:AAA family ATPase [Cylindrospermopsis sp. CR12]KRH97654.1 hypothetical protein ASL19_15010 [Cylindrospermopsis sp. CR12]